MTDPHLTLFSSNLLSKWGFNDGEDPEPWLDWCDEQGIDHAELDFPWTALVRQRLLPAIEQEVTAVDIETIHNPIRIDTVGGVDVTEVWFGRAPEPQLTPESVDVPMSEVLRIALAEVGLAEPPRSDAARLS
ncbi:hypothetical protein [Streptomyces goshikiensis]|uniref:hypothetical protein n=1 Tax=Streptomyces goshikiensis TaxID=1942 RepID=UPI002E11CA3F|nr:hypothetical protein OG224_06570 [Streptomyces goshikiensis]